MIEDPERCYRILKSRDRRFDGRFFVAVRTTGIYCRPSCPARLPKRSNVSFHRTSAGALAAGYRACKRCRPDAVPGSADWAWRSDVVARAIRLIGDGIVDREGVPGLAARLGYGERQLHRHLVAELGVGALSLARSQRAQTARILIERTSIPITDCVAAAGFSSVRQFNATIAEVYARSPSEMRQAARAQRDTQPGSIHLRLPVRAPFDGRAILGFLAIRAVPGLEEADRDRYSRPIRLAGGTARVDLVPERGAIGCSLQLEQLSDLQAAVARCRRLLDLDADPVAVDQALGADPTLGRLVAERPSLRLPGSVDSFELAVRAVLGQQVTIAGARTLTARLVAATGSDGCFPTAAELAEADLSGLGVPGSRIRALGALARAVADEQLELDGGADRDDAERGLLALPGIGPWTAGYIRMRGLGDPDVWLRGDAGLRNALDRLGAEGLADRGGEWRPWRSYAVMHLYASLAAPQTPPRAIAPNDQKSSERRATCSRLTREPPEPRPSTHPRGRSR